MARGNLPEAVQKRQMQGYYSWCPDGWKELVAKLDEELGVVDPDYELAQCKEKFGGLRYYVDFSEQCSDSEKAYEIINRYEQLSETVCDVCGKQGENRSVNGWLATRCEEHTEGDNNE